MHSKTPGLWRSPWSTSSRARDVSDIPTTLTRGVRTTVGVGAVRCQVVERLEQLARQRCGL